MRARKAVAATVSVDMKALGVPEVKQIKWLGIDYALEHKGSQQELARKARLRLAYAHGSKFEPWQKRVVM